MKSRVITNVIITVALLLLAASFWFLQTYGQARPEVAPLTAPAQQFSADRAEQVLARILGPEKPHPVSTAENARVRGRIVLELQRLGLHPTTRGSFVCHPPRPEGLICATVTNVITEVRPGAGKAIILLAHYDSVPAGPGAADDESGVAEVIETARALLARGSAGGHPVMAVLTDGEEADLLGAAGFLRDPALKARVGAVVNVEARGNRGPSFLFQTSPGDGPLMDIFAHNTSNYATSSLYHEIYRFLPNDTDLTLFIGAGFPSYNFAYVDGLFDYHTANDTRANLDPVSLQQQGDNMLGVASGLEPADFGKLRGEDDIYLDVLGRWLPRMPVSWALPLSLLVFLLLPSVGYFAPSGPNSTRQYVSAFAILPILLLVAAGSGFLLHALAQLVSGTADPSYAHPDALRISLSLALAGSVLLVSRLATPAVASIAVWFSLSAIGMLVAIYLPGFSPYFIIPSLVAAACLLASSRTPGRLEGWAGMVLLLAPALVALLIWSSIGATGEAIMGLKLHPMFTVPFAIALSTLVPLFSRFRLSGAVWTAAVVVLFAGAVCAAIVQGLEPPFSTTAAQRLSINYVQNRERAFWSADALAPVPAAIRAAAQFSPVPIRLLGAFPRVYAAPANDLRLPIPDATVIARPAVNGVRRITLLFHGSDSTDQMFLVIPKLAVLKAIELQGWQFAAPQSWSGEDSILFACMSRDCRNETVTLTISMRKPLTFGLYEHRFGLPAVGRNLLRARPATAVPSQDGDGVTLVGDIYIPAT